MQCEWRTHGAWAFSSLHSGGNEATLTNVHHQWSTCRRARTYTAVMRYPGLSQLSWYCSCLCYNWVSKRPFYCSVKLSAQDNQRHGPTTTLHLLWSEFLSAAEQRCVKYHVDKAFCWPRWSSLGTSTACGEGKPKSRVSAYLNKKKKLPTPAGKMSRAINLPPGSWLITLANGTVWKAQC
jgi:hypothetical protein